MSRHPDTVEVHVQASSGDSARLMGLLHRQGGRSGDVFSFAYDEAWLRGDETFAFDPDLALIPGPQYAATDRRNFGIFLDSSPDRWGRLLMQRRESTRARREGRKARVLTEWDYLLGVHDETRLGALRFRSLDGDRFLDSDRELAAPPLASLRELQAASLQFEQHMEEDEHPDYERWLSQLFAPGSSLGGARPKASVRDENGTLLIAKFPSRQDTRDIGAWELVAHRLAAQAGINVPPHRPLRLPDHPHTTFLAKRFDRTAAGGRLAFVSAMTLTQRRDGEPGASYLELVDLLQSRGANTEEDCKELFRRVIFSILIHNTDDHLRNHGFIQTAKGIILSPAFDINPTPDQTDLSLAINEVETRCDVDIAMQACKDYGIGPKDADLILANVRKAVGGWRREASALHVPRQEQELMAAAFP